MLDLVDREAVDKFYLSHLVYAGRGNRYREDDAYHRTTRARHGPGVRALLGLRPARRREGIRHRQQRRRRRLFPALGPRRGFRIWRAHLEAKLVAWGGNASGVNIANIDNLGNVHPDTFWWHYSLGNVRKEAVLGDLAGHQDPIMAGLKAKPRRIKGRCGDLPPLRYLRRQHAGACHAADRRSLGRRPGLLSDRRRDRRRIRRRAWRSRPIEGGKRHEAR